MSRWAWPAGSFSFRFGGRLPERRGRQPTLTPCGVSRTRLARPLLNSYTASRRIRDRAGGSKSGSRRSIRLVTGACRAQSSPARRATMPARLRVVLVPEVTVAWICANYHGSHATFAPCRPQFHSWSPRSGNFATEHVVAVASCHPFAYTSRRRQTKSSVLLSHTSI